MTNRPHSTPQRWLLSLLVALAVLTVAPQSEAGIKFCARWLYRYADQGFGEDGLVHGTNGVYGSTEASFAWAKVVKNGVTLVPGDYLNSSGCTVEVPSVAGTYQLYVRSNLQKPDGTRFEVWNGSATTPSEFTVSISVTSPPATGSYSRSFGLTAGDPVANAMAAATQFVRESAIGIAAGAPHYIVVNSPTGLSQAIGNTAHLSTWEGVNDASWKYVIAHEVGHTIQTPLFGLLNHDYDHSGAYSSNVVCNCSHIDPPYNSHCIQSREEMNAAQNEGWGHFIALDLMNDDTQTDGVFVYYKNFRCPSQWPGCPISGQMNPPLGLDGRAKYKWMDTHCPASATAHRGTEVDWMNFFFAVHATGGSGQFYFTQFRDTYRQACGGGSCAGMTAAWGDLQTATIALYGSGSLRAEHWELKGAEYGVDRIP